MDLGNSISVFFCIPFLGMLFSIAVFPLIKPEWWSKNKQYMVLFWSLMFLIPFALRFGFGIMSEQLLEVLIDDYFTFIILLFGLFCIAGNISVEGNLRGTPMANVIMLLLGTLLAGWVGTTGASMIMIRPIIHANKWRRKKMHVIIFFIFLVSNIGGCLTPVGDPPILMGFMRGIPFFWSLQMFPVMILDVTVLLLIFYILDRHAYNQDLKAGLTMPSNEKKDPVRIVGKHNIIFLGMILFAVIMSGVLPNVKRFSEGIRIYGKAELPFADLIEAAIILIAAFLSFKTTNKRVREENEFSWGAIQEVAMLFIGIFITMIPALLILETKGTTLGLTKPWEMYWVTGALSSFLDNTPTYLVFLTAAGAYGAAAGIHTAVGIVPQLMLRAISCGAVFMGANTYIGNAPNFMVKEIAEENGIHMPSFFGYVSWSVRFLIPVFIIDMLIFFLRN